MSLEALRRIVLRDTPQPGATAEIEAEAVKWEQASLCTSFLQEEVFSTSLELGRDQLKVYAFLLVEPARYYSPRDYIDIPLTDHTPEAEIIPAGFRLSFFDKHLPEEYHKFATDQFNSRHLAAFMNRRTAGVAPDDVTRWFHTTFGLTHGERYGSVRLSSHGGMGEHGSRHHVTIEHEQSRLSPTTERPAVLAARFAKDVTTSIPHISVNPLPVDSYLQEVGTTLGLLPKD